MYLYMYSVCVLGMSPICSKHYLFFFLTVLKLVAYFSYLCTFFLVLCDTCAFPLAADWPQCFASQCFGHFSRSRIEFTHVVMLLLLLLVTASLSLYSNWKTCSSQYSTLAYTCHMLPTYVHTHSGSLIFLCHTPILPA